MDASLPDTKPLAAWLDKQFKDTGDIEVARIKGGGSCELFSIFRNGNHYVMRRAPLTAVSSTAHNVGREFEIISAMQNSQVRVPVVYASCDDPTIAGAPFYLMEYIDGEVVRKRLPVTYVSDPAQQPRIGEELIDALVELHSFDWRNSALKNFGRPENYLARQTDRWLAQYAEYASRDLPAIEKVGKWLAENRPAHGDLTVMHGDYKLDNTMMSKESPPRILRVVDFEMTTIGDPLIDLAWAMIFWPEEGNLIAIAAPGSDERAMAAEYCQTPETLIQRYADKTGRDLCHFQWYQAFSAWKLAIVLEGSYAKYLSGQSKNPSHEFFGFVVDQLLLRAERFAV